MSNRPSSHRARRTSAAPVCAALLLALAACSSGEAGAASDAVAALPDVGVSADARTGGADVPSGDAPGGADVRTVPDSRYANDARPDAPPADAATRTWTASTAASAPRSVTSRTSAPSSA